jgi:hypothetical protein
MAFYFCHPRVAASRPIHIRLTGTSNIVLSYLAWHGRTPKHNSFRYPEASPAISHIPYPCRHSVGIWRKRVRRVKPYHHLFYLFSCNSPNCVWYHDYEFFCGIATRLDRKTRAIWACSRPMQVFYSIQLLGRRGRVFLARRSYYQQSVAWSHGSQSIN